MGAVQKYEAHAQIGRAIGVGRILWGLTLLLIPGPVHRLLGMQYPGPDAGLWVSAFGLRDVVLGVSALHPSTEVRRFAARAGIAADLTDAGVVMVAARRGLPSRAAVAGVMLAGGTAAIAVVGPGTIARVTRRRLG